MATMTFNEIVRGWRNAIDPTLEAAPHLLRIQGAILSSLKEGRPASAEIVAVASGMPLEEVRIVFSQFRAAGLELDAEGSVVRAAIPMRVFGDSATRGRRRVSAYRADCQFHGTSARVFRGCSGVPVWFAWAAESCLDGLMWTDGCPEPKQRVLRGSVSRGPAEIAAVIAAAFGRQRAL